MFSLSVAKLAGILAAIVALIGLGAFEQHKIDNGRYEKLVAATAEAHAKALAEAQAQQRVYDNIALASAQRERDEQASRANVAEAAARDVGNHVTVVGSPSGCVPLGLVRVHDAAASGRSAGSLSLPTGKSDGSCAGITWPALARRIVANYATARANAGQLNGLIDFYRQAQKAR